MCGSVYARTRNPVTQHARTADRRHAPRVAVEQRGSVIIGKWRLANTHGGNVLFHQDDDELTLAEVLYALRGAGTDLDWIEVKAARGGFPKNLLDSVSAFSNTAGGYIILGVDESENFAPVPIDSSALADSLVSRCQTAMTPPINPQVSIEIIDGQSLVVARVNVLDPERQPAYVTAKGMTGGSFKRLHDGDHKLTGYEVQAMQSWGRQPLYDREVLADATLKDLDEDLVANYVSRLRHSRQRLSRMSEADLLTTTGVASVDAGQLKPTLGGMLALGRYPQAHFPQLAVEIVAWPTSDAQPLQDGTRFLDNRTVEGSIPEMVRDSLLAIRTNLTRRSVIVGAGREDHWEYPEEALREALVNALMHRDYHPSSRGTQVRVDIYPDRLEVSNPGGLFGNATQAELFVSPVSSSRNATLARILEDVTLPDDHRTVGENRGSGLVAMATVLRRAGLETPRIRHDLVSFSIRFGSHALLDRDGLDWLDRYSQQTLSDVQRMALVFARRHGAITNRDLRELCALDAEQARRELTELGTKGLFTKRGDRRWANWELANGGDQPQETTTTAPVTGTATQITETRQATILQWLAAEDLSAKEIARRLDVQRQTANVVLRKLETDGRVAPTLAARTSRNNKWRLVARD